MGPANPKGRTSNPGSVEPETGPPGRQGLGLRDSEFRASGFGVSQALRKALQSASANSLNPTP